MMRFLLLLLLLLAASSFAAGCSGPRPAQYANSQEPEVSLETLRRQVQAIQDNIAMHSTMVELADSALHLTLYARPNIADLDVMRQLPPAALAQYLDGLYWPLLDYVRELERLNRETVFLRRRHPEIAPHDHFSREDSR